MLLQAADELDIDLSRSFMIGDKLADIEAGISAACRALLVRTGYGQGVDPSDEVRYEADFPDLPAAVDYVLKTY